MGYAKEWLTKEEWNRLTDAIEQKEYQRGDVEQRRWRDELLIKLTYRGGLRISEALQLQHPYNFQVEDDAGYVAVYESKTDDDPELQPVGKDIVREVSRYMNAYHGETNYVFDSGDGTPLSRQRAYQIVGELADVAGIDKKLGTHTLRRSRAKHLLDSGTMDLSEVSRFLRHDNVATTMEYLKIAKKKLAEKTAAIDAEEGL